MTALVERKLPGSPIPREQLIAEWQDLRHRNTLKGPVASFLFELHYSEPEKTFQWRIQLDCGCLRDAVTRHHTDDKPADDVQRLGELAGTYHFGLVKPSEREIREANERAGERAVQVARAHIVGTDLTDEPEQPGIFGKAHLRGGQLLCYDPKCPRYRAFGGPVRDIAEWVRLRDNRFVSQPLEIDGETIRAACEYAVWDVALSCGHFAQERTSPGWKPEDGPVRRKNPKRLPLDQVLDEIAKGDPDQGAYWRRIYTENHPDPAPFTRCRTCACVRTLKAYQRIGWLVAKTSAPTPTPPPRKTLERRLQKLEAEAARLREQIEGLQLEE